MHIGEVKVPELPSIVVSTPAHQNHKNPSTTLLDGMTEVPNKRTRSTKEVIGHPRGLVVIQTYPDQEVDAEASRLPSRYTRRSDKPHEHDYDARHTSPYRIHLVILFSFLDSDVDQNARRPETASPEWCFAMESSDAARNQVNQCPLCHGVYTSNQSLNEHTKQFHLGTVCYYPGSTRHLTRENDAEMANQLASANGVNPNAQDQHVCRWGTCRPGGRPHIYGSADPLKRHLKYEQREAYLNNNPQEANLLRPLPVTVLGRRQLE
ncbi:hypothetical protein Hte_009241 [Hypoxylon texense]